MPIAQMLLPEFDQEMANTRKLLERVPEGKFDYQPHEKSMKLGRLAGHVAEIPSYAIAVLRLERFDLAGDEKPLTPVSRNQLLDSFDKNVAEARELLAAARDEDLAKTWTLTIKGNQIFAMPRTACLRGMVMNHLIHHRAQLGVYLRLNDVAIPGMYGPSGDEANLRQAQGA